MNGGKSLWGYRRLSKGSSVRVKRLFAKFLPIFLSEDNEPVRNSRNSICILQVRISDDSESTIRSCCSAEHILAAEDLRFFAQDVVSLVMSRIGVSRSQHLVEFMWGGHHQYESDFQVLDNRMCGFWPNLPLWQIRL